VNQSKLSPANIVIVAAGAVMLIGSFLAFYKLSFSVFGQSHTQSSNGWDSGLFGIVTIVVLCGVAMAVQVALGAFAPNVSIPDKVLGLTWDQIHLALGFQAALMMFAFLVTDRGGLSLGIGFWLMLLAGIALLVGAILRVTGTGSTPRAVN
jgi:hypothetical protein